MNPFPPRWQTAQLNRAPRSAAMTGDLSAHVSDSFWQAELDRIDLFAFLTASADKGGPFGAALVAFHPASSLIVRFGGYDSNAVVSTGIASNHAEAENLSVRRRQSVVQFLSQRRGEGWCIIHLSSGESCPSCRAKQILFAAELCFAGLLPPTGGFHVVFKSTYEDALKDSGFDDYKFDTFFRFVHPLYLLKKGKLSRYLAAGGGASTTMATPAPTAAETQPAASSWMLGKDKVLHENEISRKLLESGHLVTTPVKSVLSAGLPAAVKSMFPSVGSRTPFAVVWNETEHRVLGCSADTRPSRGSSTTTPATSVNVFENTAVMRALHGAATAARQEGVFASWDLHRSVVYTNIADIGPLAYSESLWFNIGCFMIVTDFTHPEIELAARESPHLPNDRLFSLVSMEYDDVDSSPVVVSFPYATRRGALAQRYWGTKMEAEQLKAKLAEMPRRTIYYADDDGVGLKPGNDSLQLIAGKATTTTNYNPKSSATPSSSSQSKL